MTKGLILFNIFKIHDKRAIKNKILFNMYFNSGQKGNQDKMTKGQSRFNMYFNS